MTYEERRMKLTFDFDDMENADEYDAAEFTIKKQCEAIREVLCPYWTEAVIDALLLKNGYIPGKEEE